MRASLGSGASLSLITDPAEGVADDPQLASTAANVSCQNGNKRERKCLRSPRLVSGSETAPIGNSMLRQDVQGSSTFLLK